jgi:hypothetical protein
VNIRRGATRTAAVMVVAMAGGTLSAEGAGAACDPFEPGRPRALLARVPVLSSAHMTATRDGGAVIAFSSFRGTREFPGRNFSVLALDRSGCVRWRASLPGPWPIAKPVQADAGSILVASAALRGPRLAGGLRVYTLSTATGRVLHRDVFPSLGSSTGRAPTLLGDRRGNVAVVLATAEASGRPLGASSVTLKLTRRAHATRWSRQVISRSNTRPPAAMARSDGRMVVGYARGGRFWVRTGTVAGRLGQPMDAGPVAGYARPPAVALGPSGTVAAVWQSGNDARPWRLRAAVRPAGAGRFARFAQLGVASKFLAEGSPAVHVGADGHVTAGFFVPSGTGGGHQVMCANATPAGRFGVARRVVVGEPLDPVDQTPMLFGSAGSGRVVASTTAGTALVTFGPGCTTGHSELLDSAAGSAKQAAIDAQGRTWVIGQDLTGASVSGRRDLLLTVL